ncbi:MAG: transglycosylase SLT domain-containing protein [Candidatus Kryptonium sp.]|nr:transglycosylase SLT domain-containing protein [Candidatus Kryptonium sp.]MDW8108315.1 transglycosylase SLT domain-containing protein [Candidatus Kryptonium sp.]
MKVEVKSIHKLSNINVNQNDIRKAKLREAAESFEAVFLNFMLRSMLKVFSDKENSIFDGDNFGGDVLDGIFYLEISKHIAKNGKFGIAELIYDHFSKMDSVDFKINQPEENKKIEIKRENNKVEFENKQKKKLINRYGESLIDKINRFSDLIKKASKELDVPEELIKAVIAVESAGNVFAVSPKGAKGLMQLMDSTAEFVGVKNIWHPAENIYGGVKYLRHLLEKFNGDVKLALAGYNAGPENVEKYRGIPPFPETIEYVSKVMRYMKIFEQNKNLSSNEE